MILTEAGWDNYRLLTRNRTFYVVDTEYTRPGKDDPIRGSRLISIAVVPVVAGVKKPAFYCEMNPTVPVSQATQEKTGFTTAKVAGKRKFAFYAPRILAQFTDFAGVFVAHTSADIRTLRGELDRMDLAGAATDMPILPALAIIDTALLPRLLRVPGLPANTGSISLENLCQLLNVSFDPGKAHHASYDANVTADALTELLKYAAQSGTADLEELLRHHNRGTTLTPALPGRYSSAGDTHPQLPQAHLREHGAITLTPDADAETLREFAELVGECVSLKCEFLADEMAAALPLAGQLLEPLWDELGKCEKPGQAGTLLGAVALLLPEAVNSARMVRWWARHKQAVTDAVRCGGSTFDACPYCRVSASCPVDVFYTTVARVASLCGRPALTKQTVKYKLFSAPGKKDRRIEQWSQNHPELAGYMAAMVIEWERGNGGASTAAKCLKVAGRFGLQRTDPRFGMLYADYLTSIGKPDAARELAEHLLEHKTTDEAFTALRLWLDRLDQYQAAARRRDDEVLPTQRPRMVRPRSRTNPNPYRAYG